MKERVNREVALWPKLAGEANARGRADACECMSFEVVRRRQFLGGLIDSDTAGRTAGTAATNRNMRSTHQATDLQNGEPDRSFDPIVSGISDGKTFMSSSPITNLHGANDNPDQSEPGVSDPFFELRAGGRAPWIGRDTECFHALEPGRVRASVSGRGHSDLGKPEERASWDEHVSEQESGKDAPIPGADSQPKMQANGKVTPNEKDEENLAIPGPGINPEIGDFVGVIDVDASEDARPAGIDDVDEKEIRNG